MDHGRVNERPHIASVLAVAVIFASTVSLFVIYLATGLPHAVIQATVEEAVATGTPTAMPRPRVSLENALRRGDVAAVKQHMYWCLREGTCDLEKELRVAASSGDPTIARVLLAAGAKVNATGNDRQTTLHSAAAEGSTRVEIGRASCRERVLPGV